MSLLDRVLRWMKEDNDLGVNEETAKARNMARARARVIALAMLADGEESEEELMMARAASNKLPVLGALQHTAFQALVREAVSKLQTEGQEKSIDFVCQNLEDTESKTQAFVLATAILWADREMKPAEQIFSDRLRERLGISLEDASQITQMVKQSYQL